jgi:hypothetical protein
MKKGDKKKQKQKIEEKKQKKFKFQAGEIHLNSNQYHIDPNSP